MNIVDTNLHPPLHSSNRLLEALSPNDFSQLSPHLKEVQLSAQAVLYETEDVIDHIHFPQSGMISLFAVNSDGDIVETAAISRNGMVGAGSAFGIQPAFGRAVVQVPGSALRIPASQMKRLAEDNSRIREMAARAQEALLVQAQQVAMCSVVHSIDKRLARWLLQTQDRIGSNTIPMIQESLAQILGARRTTINLELRRLVSAGLVRCRRGCIDIVDRTGLKGKSCDCYSIIRQQLDRLLPMPNTSVST